VTSKGRTSEGRPSSAPAWAALAAVLLGGMLLATAVAPDFLSTPEPGRAFEPPWVSPPFGRDDRGIGLHEVALQGAAIVTLPALCSALLVAALATFAGLVRCTGMRWLDVALQAASELVGALPRLVVVLVVSLCLPKEWKGLLPIGLTWAILASPGAMDEAAATAGRLGGERFVEALRAHGFSAPRIWLYHLAWLNLRPVIARQAAEVMMQVVFLEIALSYLALRINSPSFTHPESMFSWATLLYQGYLALLGVDLVHSLVLGLLLVATVALASQAVRLAARSR
jgi:ABC-type dipeptide/oligopeptide/nickel transport system permease subunit